MQVERRRRIRKSIFLVMKDEREGGCAREEDAGDEEVEIAIIRDKLY